jgi:hypothetical protein
MKLYFQSYQDNAEHFPTSFCACTTNLGTITLSNKSNHQDVSQPPPFRNSSSAKGQRKDLISHSPTKRQASSSPGPGAPHVLPPSRILHLEHRPIDGAQTTIKPMKRGEMSLCRKRVGISFFQHSLVVRVWRSPHLCPASKEW